jgi:hypothetical protein
MDGSPHLCLVCCNCESSIIFPHVSGVTGGLPMQRARSYVQYLIDRTVFGPFRMLLALFVALITVMVAGGCPIMCSSIVARRVSGRVFGHH